MKTKPTTTTKNSIEINASPESIYKAFTTAEALTKWMVPGEMTAKIHNFDVRPGGGYEMSLFYPKSEKEMRGKTSATEDRYTAHFTKLIPSKKIVQKINFHSTDAAFAEEMIMEATLKAKGKKTKVTLEFKNIPAGIRPEDNEAGTKSSLEKLARYVMNEVCNEQ